MSEITIARNQVLQMTEEQANDWFEMMWDRSQEGCITEEEMESAAELFIERMAS